MVHIQMRYLTSLSSVSLTTSLTNLRTNHMIYMCKNTQVAAILFVTGLQNVMLPAILLSLNRPAIGCSNTEKYY